MESKQNFCLAAFQLKPSNLKIKIAIGLAGKEITKYPPVQEA